LSGTAEAQERAGLHFLENQPGNEKGKGREKKRSTSGTMGGGVDATTGGRATAGNIYQTQTPNGEGGDKKSNSSEQPTPANRRTRRTQPEDLLRERRNRQSTYAQGLLNIGEKCERGKDVKGMGDHGANGVKPAIPRKAAGGNKNNLKMTTGKNRTEAINKFQ